MVPADMHTQENGHKLFLSFFWWTQNHSGCRGNSPLRPDPMSSPPQQPKPLRLRRHLYFWSSAEHNAQFDISAWNTLFLLPSFILHYQFVYSSVCVCVHDRVQEVVSSWTQILGKPCSCSPLCVSLASLTVRLFALCEVFTGMFTQFVPHRSLFELATLVRC